MTLILASRSAARRQMLTQAGLVFEAEDSGVDEAAAKARLLADGAGPGAVALELARAKALAVSHRRPGLVLGADQTLAFEGMLVDKAPDLPSARKQLAAMRGHAHTLHSAAALAEGGEIVWSGQDAAHLTMRDFSDSFLDAYLGSEQGAALESVGAYRLEGPGAQLFAAVEGDYFTVLGLPLWGVFDALRARGVLAT